MIPFIAGRFLAVLDGLLRAPLQAGKTLLAPLIPGRLPLLKDYVSGRTDLAADLTLIAFFIDPELSVHFRYLAKTHFIEKREKHPLPEGSFFHRHFLFSSYRYGDFGNLFLGRLKPLILLLLRPGPAPRDIIGWHCDLKSHREVQPLLL